MNQLHIQHLHAGPQALLTISRQKYWITQGRNLARSIFNNCVTCVRAKPQSLQQLMGNLPASRVLPGRPFITTGVDFCGPIWTHYRIRGKRPQKTYVAVFCCFATKAVHLEVVSDLSTEAFIGALKRMISRRGYCREIYCDNATNFVGANNQLKELYDILQKKEEQKKIINCCLEKRIQFHFIPPRSPHFGGLWEAAVKSFKTLFTKVLASSSLTYEELCTITAEIEAVLNSRPLTPLSASPDDLAALTPAHFLIEESLSSIPEPGTSNLALCTRWKLISSIKQEFWKRWKEEYLTELQKRTNWTQKRMNIATGTLVVIKDDNLPPCKWPLGRIVAVKAGSDGLIRVVDVKTATGVFRRAIHNLCPLPIETGEHTFSDETTTRSESNKRTKTDEGTNEQKPIKRRRGVPNIGTMLMIILLALPLIAGNPTNKYVDIEKFNHQPGIYYESLGAAKITSHDWKWFIYYDMAGYWDLLKTIKKGVHGLQTTVTDVGYFKAVLSQFQHTVAEIDQVNEVILSNHGKQQSKRTRRGVFNGIGTIAHYLFGVLDEEYASEISETIKSVENNENHLMTLLRNQTSVIEATESIIKKSQIEIGQQMKLVEKTINTNLKQMENMTLQLREQSAAQNFLTLTLFLTLITTEYQRIQTTLLDTILDVHHGKMNPRIMSLDKLKNQASVISEHLPSSLDLPTKDTTQLYQLMTVKCYVTTNYTIFAVRLPLILRSEFELYKLIPLPSLINNTYVAINPSTELIMIDLPRESFYALSPSEFEQCRLVEDRIHICPQHHPIYNRNSPSLKCEADMINLQHISDDCAISITTPRKIWIQLSSENHWLFSLDKEYIYNIVCNGNAFQLILSGIGQLTFKQRCVMKDADVIINSHSAFTTTLTSTFTPKINLSNHLTIPENLMVNNKFQLTTTFRDHTEDITKLQERLINIRHQELPFKMQAHDLHQYTVGYTALIITITIAVLLLCLYCKFNQSLKNVIQGIRTHQPQRSNTDAKCTPTPAPRQADTPATRDFRFELRDFNRGENVKN